MNLKSKIATLVLASTIALGAASPALAQDTTTATTAKVEGNVTVQIDAGTLTYSIDSANLDPIAYNETDATDITGGLNITVNGNGNLGGWTLQVSATDFVYGGSSTTGKNIPAANLRLTSAGEPGYDGGQVIVDAGPETTNVTGSFASPMKVITSGVNSGSGSYSQALGFELTVPEASQVGTYKSTVTVETTSAP